MERGMCQSCFHGLSRWATYGKSFLANVPERRVSKVFLALQGFDPADKARFDPFALDLGALGRLPLPSCTCFRCTPPYGWVAPSRLQPEKAAFSDNGRQNR